MIPARSGSKGVPHKNIKEIDGHPLLAYAIAFGLKLGVDRVIVSTDSEEYAEIARSYGAEVPCLRSPQRSGDGAREEDTMQDLTETLPKHGVELPDLWIRLKPTNPFRSVKTVKEGLRMFEGSDAPDSVRIVNRSDARVCIINEDGWLEPYSRDWDPKYSVIPRTLVPQVYSPFNLDICRQKMFEERHEGYMGTRIKAIVDHAITGVDINEPDDFDIVKAMIESRPEPPVLKEYLARP